MQVFKIRRKTDGKFSNGGMSPGFTKQGKIWKGLGPLNNHINLVNEFVYRDCELVTYELIEEELNKIDLTQHIAERNMAKAEKERLRRERFEEIQKQKRYQDFLKLQNEFGEK